MTTRAELKEILAEVLNLDADDVSIISANDDGDVKIEVSELFLDDTDDNEEEDEDEDEEVKEDEAVEEDANTVHDSEEETKAE
jgi:hypothetical protein